MPYFSINFKGLNIINSKTALVRITRPSSSTCKYSVFGSTDHDARHPGSDPGDRITLFELNSRGVGGKFLVHEKPKAKQY